MPSKDQQPKYEQRSMSELEHHIAGLRSTENEIREMRLHARMGKSGVKGIAPLAMYDGDYGRYSFAESARKFSRRLSPRQNPDKKMYADILSTVPPLVDAMDDISSDEATRNYQSKLHLAEFNGMLRDIIDTHPHIQPGTIISLIRSTTLRYGYPPEVINATAEKTQASLYAMKHELAYASALYRLPYDVEETDAIDDKDGIDYRVNLPNGVTINIDVKSSEIAAQHSIAEIAQYSKRIGRPYPAHKLITYSGFTSEDFTPENPWRPTEEAVNRVLPHIDATLRKMGGLGSASVTENAR